MKCWWLALVEAEVEHLDDVRVHEPGGRERLAPEARDERRVVGEVLGEQLDRDVALEPLVEARDGRSTCRRRRAVPRAGSALRSWSCWSFRSVCRHGAASGAAAADAAAGAAPESAATAGRRRRSSTRAGRRRCRRAGRGRTSSSWAWWWSWLRRGASSSSCCVVVDEVVDCVEVVVFAFAAATVSVASADRRRALLEVCRERPAESMPRQVRRSACRSCDSGAAEARRSCPASSGRADRCRAGRLQGVRLTAREQAGAAATGDEERGGEAEPAGQECAGRVAHPRADSRG